MQSTPEFGSLLRIDSMEKQLKLIRNQSILHFKLFFTLKLFFTPKLFFTKSVDKIE